MTNSLGSFGKAQRVCRTTDSCLVDPHKVVLLIVIYPQSLDDIHVVISDLLESTCCWSSMTDWASTTWYCTVHTGNNIK